MVKMIIFLIFTLNIDTVIRFFDYLKIKNKKIDFFSLIDTKNFLDSITFDNSNYVKINI